MRAWESLHSHSAGVLLEAPVRILVATLLTWPALPARAQLRWMVADLRLLEDLLALTWRRDCEAMVWMRLRVRLLDGLLSIPLVGTGL